MSALPPDQILFENEPTIMHCANCQASVKLSAFGAAPTLCFSCGAPLGIDSSAPSRRPNPAARRGGALWITIAVLLIVGLAAVSVASTYYAMRMIEERDRTQEDLAQSSNTLDKVVLAVANSSKLKGAGAAEDRQEILQPAVEYYDQIIEKYQDDESKWPAVAAAQFHRAALQAKLGVPECVTSLSDGMRTIHAMIKADFGEESYPAFTDSIRIPAQMDWVSVKGSTPMDQGVALYAGIRAGNSAYIELTKRFPKSIQFRDDHVWLLKSSAIFANLARRPDMALINWNMANAVLETMVRDEPDNTDFQERLVESLVNSAKIEDASGNTDKAISNYKRAVEVRQKMVDANPDDKSLEKALAGVQRDLERVESAADSKKQAGQDAAPADDASKKDASAEQLAKDAVTPPQAEKEETPKEEADKAPKDDAAPEK